MTSQAISRNARIGLAAALVILLAAATAVLNNTATPKMIRATAYFENTNGVYPGDEVRILGVAVGKIDTIEPEPDRAKVTFSYDAAYPVPADAKAVILSPSLVTSRAIQLTPAYTGGATMSSDAVIPIERTAVPVEYDDFREQLQKLTDALQPTQPGGVSTLGAFVDTAAANMQGNGAAIRDTIIKLSQAFSILGDQSQDIFGTVRNLSILVTALQSSRDLIRELNVNLAAVTRVLANRPDEIGQAVAAIDSVIADVRDFVARNRDPLGTTTEKLASITTALNESRGHIKQILHIAPTAAANTQNIYQPAQASLTGVLAANNFANPITFLCGAIQAASRLGAEQSSKLCVQYLAPIIKNRQLNFPPIGLNPFVGASARPNELTYSEDWIRPDYIPPHPVSGAPQPAGGIPLLAEAPAVPVEPTHTDPSAGLTGLMVPPGAGQ